MAACSLLEGVIVEVVSSAPSVTVKDALAVLQPRGHGGPDVVRPRVDRLLHAEHDARERLAVERDARAVAAGDGDGDVGDVGRDRVDLVLGVLDGLDEGRRRARSDTRADDAVVGFLRLDEVGVLRRASGVAEQERRRDDGVRVVEDEHGPGEYRSSAVRASPLSSASWASLPNSRAVFFSSSVWAMAAGASASMKKSVRLTIRCVGSIPGFSSLVLTNGARLDS